jgi:hypothetical protein
MPPLTWIRERYLEPVKATLGSDCFQRVCAQGRAMPVAEAIALARQRSALLRPGRHGTATGWAADRGRGMGRRSRGAAIRSKTRP